MSPVLPAPLRLAFGLVLRLLPVQVRRRHGREMAAHLAAAYAAARARGRGAAVVESVAELADVAVAGVDARLGERRRGVTVRSKGPSSVPHDLRQAWRTLASRPAYALLTIVTLALGIGASTAVFSVVDTLLLRPLPFREPHRLVELNTRLPQQASIFHATPARFAQAWREQAAIFEGVEYYDDQGMVIGDSAPERVSTTMITPGLFPLLGVAPALGRSFTDDEARAPVDVAIISDGLWSRRFGRDPGILEKSIRLDDRPYRIVGVMPQDFRFPAGGSDVWLPLDLSTLRPTQGVSAAARLALDVPLALAQERADVAVSAFQTDREPAQRLGVQIRPLGGPRTTTGTRQALYVLLGAVGFVLLIGCANAANLALTQGMSRVQELSVRAALGAGRLRLVRQLLFESVTLALAGGALGVVFAYWGLAVILDVAPREITRQTFTPIGIDWRILGFALGLSTTTGLLFGTLPAWRAARVDAAEALNQAGRSATASRGQRRLRTGLAAAEIALAVVLLSGAGLLINSFVRLQRVDPGFDLKNLVTVALQVPAERYPTGAVRLAFLEEITGRVRELPGVTAVTVAGGAPPGSGAIFFNITPEAENRPAVPFSPRASLPVTPIAPDYFATLGIPILQGSTFTAADYDQPVVIVSETMARRYWADERPVGRRFRLSPKGNWSTVVGVARDVKQMGFADPNGSEMEMYRPLSRAENANSYYTVIARASGDARALLPIISSLVWSADDRLPIHDASTVEALYAETLREERFYLSLMMAFALVAGLMAVVGVYGVVSYGAEQRTREFGLRIALGATAADLRRLVVGGGVFLTAIGLAVGLAAAVWLTRLLEAQLFEVAPADPLTLAAVALLLGAVAVTAGYIPARRACRIDPMQALRRD